MRNFLLCLLAAATLAGCNQENKKSTKKTGDSAYVISKNGIGELKVGMSQTEVEKLLNQHFDFNAVRDAPGYWSDTVKSKYKDIDVTLYFERQYTEDDKDVMQLIGVETTSSLCRTESGLGIGEDKTAIIQAFDDNSIYMGPEYEMVNDSTWLPSKTKYSINVKDDKYDNELIFHLVNKKVASLHASVILGD